eukprot:Skav230824  [mRNA]  locus=scaffold851:447293:448795:+ [translate_table: standard]
MESKGGLPQSFPIQLASWQLSKPWEARDPNQLKEFVVRNGATFIACLGQALAKDGTVPDALKNRAEKAQVLKNILTASPYSIKEDALLLDEKATNTMQNALGTLAKIQETGAKGDLKIYLVTSDWHAPRSELSFRSVFDNCRKEGEGEVVIESCPAYSALRNDTADYPGELLKGHALQQSIAKTNEQGLPWGVVLRLCLENEQMEKRVLRELNENDVKVDQLKPESLTLAFDQLQTLLEKVRQGGYGRS